MKLRFDWGTFWRKYGLTRKRTVHIMTLLFVTIRIFIATSFWNTGAGFPLQPPQQKSVGAGDDLSEDAGFEFGVKQITVVAGHNLTLHCYSGSQDVLNKVLAHNGTTIARKGANEEPPNHNVSNAAKIVSDNGSFIVRNVTESDAGVYECLVTFISTDLGMHRPTYNVTVTPGDSKAKPKSEDNCSGSIVTGVTVGCIGIFIAVVVVIATCVYQSQKCKDCEEKCSKLKEENASLQTKIRQQQDGTTQPETDMAEDETTLDVHVKGHEGEESFLKSGRKTGPGDEGIEPLLPTPAL